MSTLPTPGGSIRLFRLAGINVYLHWSWLIMAVLAYNRKGNFGSPIWSLAEYLTLFVIVLLHEFGHSLACRSVGGKANQIVLWPLGGVAYVQPPPRPGAFLWSIAAGPLVNALLVPVTLAAFWLCPPGHHAEIGEFIVPDITKFCLDILWMNVFLLAFNVLPIYPLDGGQILQSLLWFVLPRSTSILVASVIGIMGGVAVGIIALLVLQQWWLALISLFIVMQAWMGVQYAMELWRRERFYPVCPECGAAPPQGPGWKCPSCGSAFDLFASGGACPRCGNQFAETSCPNCGAMRPISRWYAVPRGRSQA